MLSGDLHQRTLDALGDVPRTAAVEGRDTLLEGIPKNVVRGLNRYSQRDIDLSKLITQLYDLGRLEESGARPLLIFLGNAQKTVDGTSPGRILKDIIQEIERLDEEDTLFFSLPALSLPAVPEALIFGGSDERLSYEFFEKAILVQKSVARLQVPRIFGSVPDGKSMVGTGWLVAPGLLFTNYHVIDARRQNLGEKAASQTEFRAQAIQTMAWFDYYTEGGPRTECRCIELISSDVTLDYALLRLEKTPFLEDRGSLVIAQQLILIRADRLNIIQYPSGGPLRYAVRNNFYVGADNSLHFIRYLTDTEGGSSGSPVFNDNWQVVAMHRAARPVPPEHYKGETIKYHNEGIEIHPILNHLPSLVRQEISACAGYLGHPFAKKMGVLVISVCFSELWLSQMKGYLNFSHVSVHLGDTVHLCFQWKLTERKLLSSIPKTSWHSKRTLFRYFSSDVVALRPLFGTRDATHPRWELR